MRRIIHRVYQDLSDYERSHLFEILSTPGGILQQAHGSDVVLGDVIT